MSFFKTGKMALIIKYNNDDNNMGKLSLYINLFI